MTIERHRIRLLAAIAATLAAPRVPFAADYPARDLRLVVPYPPGGATDFIARTLGAEMSSRLGRPIVIENRPGATTNVAAEMVAHAPPDGHLLMLADTATLATNVSLYRKLPYDPQRDLLPVARIARIPLLLVVPAESPTPTLATLLAKARQGNLVYGSGGLGSPHHLAMELFARRAGFRAQHVPYKGAAPMLQDLLGARLDVAFLDLPTARGAIAGGRLRALATGTKTRLDALPGLSTLDESGMPGFDAFAWQGLVVPARTPDAVVTRLYGVVDEVLRMPALRQKLDDAGVEAFPANPGAFAAFISAERTRWSAVIREAALSLE